jgi:hypothetical protein
MLKYILKFRDATNHYQIENNYLYRLESIHTIDSGHAGFLVQMENLGEWHRTVLLVLASVAVLLLAVGMKHEQQVIQPAQWTAQGKMLVQQWTAQGKMLVQPAPPPVLQKRRKKMDRLAAQRGKSAEATKMKKREGPTV